MATHEHEGEHHRDLHREHHRVHIDEADWRATAEHVELEGEIFLAFVTESAAWVEELRDPGAPPVRAVIDIGSGPGVGTCELAKLFPDAHVIAVDSSPGMLERTRQRATEHGFHARISTHLAELPAGLDGFVAADVIWASMSLHHIGDEVALLRVLRDLLDPSGLIAIAELAEPTRLLPDDLDLGRPGLAERLDTAGAAWFEGMRHGLTNSVRSTGLPTMLASAGLEAVGSRLARERLDAPLSDDGRRFALGHLRRLRDQLCEHLDDDDLRSLDVLTDADDPRSVNHRSDVFVAGSRQIMIARPYGGGQ